MVENELDFGIEWKYGEFKFGNIWDGEYGGRSYLSRKIGDGVNYLEYI